MKLSGAKIVLESLRRNGVEVIFGLPGGVVLPIYDALLDYPDLKHVLVRHEANAGHAADGYARVTGKPGVVLVTSGPAVTNLVTGLQSAYLDSIPMVALTGQVPTYLLGRDAFQEADNVGLTRSCTKHNLIVKHPRDLAAAIKEAFYIAQTGRPGPVHVDLPKDVLTGEVEFEYPEQIRLRGYRPPYEGHVRQVQRAAQKIRQASRPVILAGGGIIAANAVAELRALSELAQIPVTTTLMGLGAFPSEHALSLGMPGMHGVYWANMAIDESDCLIVVGARLDDRVTGRIEDFAPRAELIHIDIDPTSISMNVKAHVPIVGDARVVLGRLANELASSFNGTLAERRRPWLEQIAEWRRKHPLAYEADPNAIKPQHAIQVIANLLPESAIVTTGVGQHQMWAAQYLRFASPRRWCTSGGLGAMGYGLPAAIGAQVAFPNRLVVNIDGDGSFVMNSIELATAVSLGLAVKTIILNNGSHGMVRQWQRVLYGGRYSAVDLHGLPDFVKLAEAYGCYAIRATRPSELVLAVEQLVRTSGPALLDVVVDRAECVYPMVAPGMANRDMLLGPEKEVATSGPGEARAGAGK